MFTVGVDLGKRNSQYCVRDSQGEILAERKLPNRRETVQRFLRSLPGPIEVACETCLNTYWFVEVVDEIGIPIAVGHARKMRLIAEARSKTDVIDARTIGELKRTGFFPAIAIPPAAIRHGRELMRGRVRLMRTMSQMLNRLHGVLTRAGVEYAKEDVHGLGVEAWLDSLDLCAEARLIAHQWMSIRRELEPRLRELDREIRNRARSVEAWRPILDRLQTIPGVGEFSAILLLLELWDIDRFPSIKRLVSYVGLAPGVSQTGQGPYRGEALTKEGNRYIRWILVQDAWSAIQHSPRYRGLYEHYVRTQGKVRAVIPTARQLLYDIYRVWKHKITYEELIRQKNQIA
jgi:transposase